MTSHTLYRSANILFYFDPSIPCVINEWREFIPSHRFREGILKLLEISKEMIQKYPNLQLLADTRTLGTVSRADLNWVSEEINPHYVELGIYHEAFVVSEDAFGQMALNRYVITSTDQGLFTVKIFASMEEAREWLMEMANRAEKES